MTLPFWFRFLLFPTLAVAAYPLFLLGVGGDHWLVQTGWIVFLSYCWFCVAGSFHEAAHQTLFRSPSLNVWCGRVWGTLIGIPYTVYRETHRRHHAYLNTPGDYELWPYSDPTTSIWFRRAFVWIDLFFGVFTAPYIYGRIYFKRDARLSQSVRRTIFFEYVGVWVCWAAIAVGVYFLLLWENGVFKPLRLYFLLPWFISPMLNTGRKFVEHLGLESTDPVLGTRTVYGPNPVSRCLSYFNFDIAIHGPHHRYPRAKHDELSTRLQACREAHPDQTIPVFNTYLSALIDLIPCLWRRPSTGTGAGEYEAIEPSTLERNDHWDRVN
jgi:fatty acid desaturase